MNRFQSAANWACGRDLEQMIEPLASYICATEEPRTALISALTLLFREVEGTHRAALAQLPINLQN